MIYKTDRNTMIHEYTDQHGISRSEEFDLTPKDNGWCYDVNGRPYRAEDIVCFDDGEVITIYDIP